AGIDGEPAAEPSRAVTHPRETGREPRAGAGRVEAAAVVLDLEREACLIRLQANHRFGGRRVPGHVGQRLLRDSDYRRLCGAWNPPVEAFVLEGDSHARPPTIATDEPRQRRHQAEIVEDRRPE